MKGKIHAFSRIEKKMEGLRRQNSSIASEKQQQSEVCVKVWMHCHLCPACFLNSGCLRQRRVCGVKIHPSFLRGRRRASHMQQKIDVYAATRQHVEADMLSPFSPSSALTQSVRAHDLSVSLHFPFTACSGPICFPLSSSHRVHGTSLSFLIPLSLFLPCL